MFRAMMGAGCYGVHPGGGGICLFPSNHLFLSRVSMGKM